MAGFTLLTTGYSGHNQETFVEKLRRHQVNVIVDVRQRPLSRKKGFSRTALAALLADNGVEYVHLRELGVPSTLRDQLKNGAVDLQRYLQDFGGYVTRQAAVLDDVYAMAMKGTCCLLCVEHRAEECHRSVVADAVAARNGRRVKIQHI
jgi:uncharacterized protein (DUF488 family)